MTRKGFTLIELLVVVAVLALLASIVFSNLGGAREGAKISNALSFQSQTHSLLGSDLVGWWNFNDSFSRYKDISGYGNDGSCATSCPTPVDGVPGTGGTAMEFDGGDNKRIHTTDISDVLGNQVTYSAWVNRYESLNAYNMFMGRYLPYFAFRENGNFFFSIRIDGTQRSLNSNSSYTNNEWYHYVATFNGNEMRIYVNGEDDGSASYPGNITYDAGHLFAIGDGRNGNWYRFKGKIDDVRIYSRALTASEVQILYAQTKGKYLAND